METVDEIRTHIITRLLAASENEVRASMVTPETSLRNDLGLNSLQAVQLVVEFEEKYGIDVADEELGKLQTVGDVVQLVTSSLQNRKEDISCNGESSSLALD
jgi:acyl carrier protein